MINKEDLPIVEPPQLVNNSIQRNTLYNIAGALIPIIISLVTVPFYLKLIGEERYGVLAIIWLLLGYYGVFTLGFGKAIANQVAKLHNESNQDLDILFWTALFFITLIGLLGGLTLFAIGSFYFNNYVKIASEFRSEAIAALPWLIVAVPINTASAVLVGALEGRERFAVVNYIGMFGVALSQLTPFFYALFIRPHLPQLVGAVILSHLASAMVLYLACRKFVPILTHQKPKFLQLRQLFSYGSWVTITTLLTPLLTIVDQFMISTKLGIAVLPVYNIPYNLVNRMTIFPYSLSRTLFPQFSLRNHLDAKTLSQSYSLIITVLMTPSIVVSLIILRPFLNIWIGPVLTKNAAPVGEILLMGIWLNSMATIPYTFLQGQGRPDLTAKFHLIELPIYIVLLVVSIDKWGIIGAAWSWSSRMLLDLVLLAIAAKYTQELFSTQLFAFCTVASAGFCVLYLFVHSPDLRMTLGSILLLISLFWAWMVSPLQFQKQIRFTINNIFRRIRKQVGK